MKQIERLKGELKTCEASDRPDPGKDHSGEMKIHSIARMRDSDDKVDPTPKGRDDDKTPEPKKKKDQDKKKQDDDKGTKT